MIFKDPKSQTELEQSPQKLRDVVVRFEELCAEYEIEPVCTRVWGKISGDSGVHAAKRAADFRDQTFDAAGKERRVFSEEQVMALLDALNKEFPRDDGKKVAIHHSFDGMPYHFHLQIPIAWVTPSELKTIYGGTA